jgi:sarcosine oxidase, subunit alpha
MPNAEPSLLLAWASTPDAWLARLLASAPMFHRTRPITDRVVVTLDGKELPAERGEPLAATFLANGEKVLARSPKLHRPRGPSCFRGDCDGCIARVDGAPNTMLCRRACQGGEEVKAQNVLGTREVDLLRVTDWFFPKGIDHHHLLAGIPGASTVMQTFARQMAGIGRLPDEAVPPRPAERRRCDVLVLGGGLAGLLATAALATRGLDVTLVEEALELGEHAAALPDLAEEVARLRGDVAPRAIVGTALGVFDGAVLVDRKDPRGVSTGALVVTPAALVFATGAHDAVLLCEGNDLPGVMSARAVLALVRRGIEPNLRAGQRVGVVGHGPFARALRSLLPGRTLDLAEEDVTALVGTTEVTRVRLASGAEEPVGVVAIDLPGAPSFELAEQAGATVTRTSAGFGIGVDSHGRVTLSPDALPSSPRGLFALGECTGAPLDLASFRETAETIAAAIAADHPNRPG